MSRRKTQHACSRSLLVEPSPLALSSSHLLTPFCLFTSLLLGSLPFSLSLVFPRRAQSNFQLIIITHDETFVDTIGRSAHADYYYRVYKDDAQHSKIRRQAIVQDEPMGEDME